MDRRSRVLAFWSWNNEIEEEEITEQIASMAGQGIGGFFLHCRAGLKVPYLGERFLELAEHAVRQAERRGMEVWLYDENGWPSGSGNGAVCGLGPRYQAKRLRFFAKPPPGCRVLARYCADGDAMRLCGEAEAELYVCVETDPHYADLSEPDATEAFLACTHEVYRARLGKYFGGTVRGVFTDEPQLKEGTPWSDRIPAAFEAKTGASVFDMLYTLAGCRPDPDFRYEYMRTVSDLYEAGFVQRVSRWCSDSGLRFTGHFPCEDGLIHQYETTGGVMRGYEFMDLPGIDHLGRRLASPLLLRQAGSVADQLEKRDVLSETFGCTGWGASFPQLSWIWGYQAAHGVSVCCLHLAAYSLEGCRKRDYPAFFSYQEPWWNKFHYLSDWIAGMGELAVWGRSRADMLVLSPLESLGQYAPESNGQRYESNQFRLLIEALAAAQADFHIGDATLSERHAGLNEAGELTLGAGRYRTVVVPDCGRLAPAAQKLVQAFAARGAGTVLYANRLPSWAPASPLPYGGVVENRADLWRKALEFIGYARPVRLVSASNGRPVAGLCVRLRVEGGVTQCMVCNPSEENEVHAVLEADGAGRFVEIYPDGTCRALASTCAQSGVRCPIALRPMECRVFRFGGVPPCPARKENLFAVKTVPLTAPRRGENTLTLDRAQVRLNGSWSQELPVTAITGRLYDAAQQAGKALPFQVRYRFFQGEGADGNLFLAAETGCMRGLRVNGGEVPLAGTEWYLDRSIRRYDVTSLTKRGENLVELYGEVAPCSCGFDLGKVHEAERNRFAYPVEVESVYLCGDFSVVPQRGFFERCGCIQTAGGFSLRPPRALKGGDVTVQGLPFYRGSLRYAFSLNWDGASRVELDLAGMRGVLAEVSKGGEVVGAVTTPTFTLDVTNALERGENFLEAELFSSNRNTLGPHHHRRGEPNFTGVNTFLGTWGYEDAMADFAPPRNTWTEDYSFIPFGLDCVRILYYK